MTVWVVRAGRHGEQEEAALKGNFVTHHWNELGDLSTVQDKEALAKLYRKANPNATTHQVASGVGQVWAFYKNIEPGHLVVLPGKRRLRRALVAIGEVTGPYCYRNDLGEEILHTLPVQWLRKDIPRTSFQKDLQKSLGRPPTVYQISRNNAEEQIRAVLRGQEPPGFGSVRPDLRTRNETELSRVLEGVGKKIAKHKGTLNEATTQTALINPVLGALGWDVENPDQVIPQFRPGGTDPVDYALFIERQTSPILLVEAKALDHKLDGWANKIMGYAGTSGATWVVLTNGDEYRIYFAAGGTMGIGERLFRTVRLTDQNSPAEETLAMFSRERIGDLQGMWDNERADRQVRAAIERLFSPEPHSQLVNFVRREVREVAGLTTTQIRASVSRICQKIKIL